MGQIIIPNAVVREKGKLYYIDGEGNLCEATLQHGITKEQGRIIKERNKAKRLLKLKKREDLEYF